MSFDHLNRFSKNFRQVPRNKVFIQLFWGWLNLFLFLGLFFLSSCTSHEKKCHRDADCTIQMPRCVEGNCVECVLSSDCTEGKSCIEHHCVLQDASLPEEKSVEEPPPEKKADQSPPPLCGNGVCDIGREDCLSCAQDCPCHDDEHCVGGVCQKRDRCGNGQCESSENCTTCPKDCGCMTGEICQEGQCSPHSSCGNGICEGSLSENCSTCPRDCTCPGGQKCNSQKGICSDACGDHVCSPQLGETCTTCPKDCPCYHGQKCIANRCEDLCGNGVCEAAQGENCSTCPTDCACPKGQKCLRGRCGEHCGDGKCDPTSGENCATCSQDCACPTSQICLNGHCQSPCGDKICDKSRGENCSTCSKDCACPSTHYCESGICKHRCGDTKCDKTHGENCSTCPIDCACPVGEVCQNARCVCVPHCQKKECGDDGCGGSCGTCSGLKTCQNGHCVCQNQCKQGYQKCLSKSSYERCERGADGCWHLKTYQCSSGAVCQNGSCCAGGCDGKNCGDDGCGGTCGTCSSHEVCQSGRCQCKHECKENEAFCLDSARYKSCLKDSNQCRYWSSPQKCSANQVCKKGHCCTRQCQNKECGDDGCGGICGTCTVGCSNNLCLRSFQVISIYFPCGLCDDVLGAGPPDLVLKLTLSTGQHFKSQEIESKCNRTVTFRWQVNRLDATSLTRASLKVIDVDVNKDDFCGSWEGNFSKVGSFTLKNPRYKNIQANIQVGK